MIQKRIVWGAVILTIAYAGLANAQMAKIAATPIKGTCGVGCKLLEAESSVRISRHIQMDPKTEVKVELQQLYYGPEIPVTNPDGSMGSTRKIEIHVVDRTIWTNQPLDSTSSPDHAHLIGPVVGNEDGNHYGYFRIAAKMRKFEKLDDNGDPVYSREITFLHGPQTKLTCDGCGNGGTGGGSGVGGVFN